MVEKYKLSLLEDCHELSKELTGNLSKKDLEEMLASIIFQVKMGNTDIKGIIKFNLWFKNKVRTEIL